MNFLSTTLIVLFISFSNNPDIEIKASNYIDEHKELAIIEMYRSGIPASIILAQALHESNYGGSDLAVKANNHFGIKCKSYWEGSTFYHEDDDTDARGRLIESCFRAYTNVYDSYIDHSNFLMHTRHYQHLFNHSRYDYTSWARGLQSSGYATDPNYANKLIRIVEKYNLDLYDKASDPFRKLKSLE